VTLSPRIFILVLCTSLLASNIAARDLYHANESSLQLSRYINLFPGPTNAQLNPLHMVLPNISFTAEVKSIEQAMRILLKDTGFHLAQYHPDKRVFQMFRLSLPKIQRHMGPLTLEQALKTLSGEPWILSIDPFNRLVSFQLPDYIKTTVQSKIKPQSRPPSRKVIIKPKRAVWPSPGMGDISAHVVSIPEDELADLLKANIQSGALLAEANDAGSFIDPDKITLTQPQCLIDLENELGSTVDELEADFEEERSKALESV